MVKNTSINTLAYNPGDPGGIGNFTDLIRFLREENIKVSAALSILAAGHLDKTTVAPTKPRDGDLRYADGVSWNPGGTGRGLYMYNGTAWVLVKAI